MDARNAELVLSHIGLATMTARRFAKSQEEYRDFIQEGCLGLMRASQLYDPQRPTKFSTMAMPWVRKFVRQAAMRRGPIHIPFGVQYARKRENAECVKTGKIEPHPAMQTISLDFFDPPGGSNPEEIVLKKCDIERIEASMDKLTKTELLVIKLVSIGKGTEEIGRLFKFSKQRASQIFNRAIAKIRGSLSEQDN